MNDDINEMLLQSLVREIGRFPPAAPIGMMKRRIDETVAPLGDRNIIVHEWTVKPGKRLFVKFGSKFKETICGKGGPHEQFTNGLIGQEKLPTVVASSLLIAGFSTATFWYPLAAYLSILLLKTGLKAYCES